MRKARRYRETRESERELMGLLLKEREEGREREKERKRERVLKNSNHRCFQCVC